MNNDQRAMCFAEWKKCWAALQESAAVTNFADEKAARVAITRKAIGREKSWGDPWQQKEIDQLLAVMWSISSADSLELQLRQIDQPLTRAEGSVFAQQMLTAIGIDPHGREAYLNAICQRIHRKPLCDINDAEWRDVLAALNHTRLHKQGVGHFHGKAGGAAARRPSQGASHRAATQAPKSIQPF